MPNLRKQEKLYVVYKYTLLDIFRIQNVKLPQDCSIIHFARQHENFCIWCLVNPNQKTMITRRFCIRPTGGDPITSKEFDTTTPLHRGTCLTPEGQFVWHLFELSYVGEPEGNSSS